MQGYSHKVGVERLPLLAKKTHQKPGAWCTQFCQGLPTQLNYNFQASIFLKINIFTLIDICETSSSLRVVIQAFVK